jgi:hypothetical protein
VAAVSSGLSLTPLRIIKKKKKGGDTLKERCAEENICKQEERIKCGLRTLDNQELCNFYRRFSPDIVRMS